MTRAQTLGSPGRVTPQPAVLHPASKWLLTTMWILLTITPCGLCSCTDPGSDPAPAADVHAEPEGGRGASGLARTRCGNPRSKEPSTPARLLESSMLGIAHTLPSQAAESTCVA